MPHSPTDTGRGPSAATPADLTAGPPSHNVRALAWLLLVGGLVGALAAFVLMVEKLAVLVDGSYVPSCSLNPVLNCGSIMRTDQAELFGFPNPLIGIAAFPVVAATGAAVLSGALPGRRYWLALQTGVVLGMVFVGWLVFQSLYRIGALCPYCMIVWAVVWPIAWYATLYNARAGHLGHSLQRSRAVLVLGGNHAVVLTIGYLLALTLVATRFWDYWSSLL